MISTGSNPQSSVDVWNSVAPVGTPVSYWVGREPRQALTTSRALVVDGVASVRVSGRAFPVALSHVSLVRDGGAS